MAIFALCLVRLRHAPPPPRTAAASSPESLNSRFLFNPLRRITGSETTTKDLKEKKKVVEEADNGRDAPANGNANQEDEEQEAGNEVDEEGGEEEEEEEEGDGEEEDGDEDEEAESAPGKRAAEGDEDDDVDTKKQKPDKDHQTAKKEKLNSKKRRRDLFTLHFRSQNLTMAAFG
nr:prothymosin alpha-like [Gorilla gorilla gorilla]